MGISVLGSVGVADDCVESIVVISGVVDSPDGAIGLHQGVVSLHHITVPSLGLALLVPGVMVGYAVVKLVGRMRVWFGSVSLGV